ncbi:MAG: AAA family ATPase [Solirubrobacterales bacterium]
MKEPRNPFRFGPLALDEAFANREVELKELKNDAINGQDAWIVAPRRYGKSSLVWRAMQELASERMLVAHVNLMTAPTKTKLAEKLARSIYEDVASPLERAREKALAPFRGLRVTPTVTVSPDDASLSFGFTSGREAADVDATLERLFELPAELAAERGRRAVLIIDEFQEILDIDPQLPKLMRTVFEQQPDTAHLYLGSKRHLMEKIFNDANEPFWRSARQLELGPIDSKPFSAFIRKRFRDAGKDVSPKVTAELLDRSGGHPYATQEFCYFLWEATSPGAVAGFPEFERALTALLRSENTHFTLLWDEASSVQRVLLQALAAEPGRPFTKEYRARHQLPPATNVQKALTALRKRDLVQPRNGEQRIVEPFFDAWIRSVVTAEDEASN